MTSINSLQPESITNRDDWESIVSCFHRANFLQSFQWKTFHENLGKKCWALVWRQQSEAVRENAADGGRAAGDVTASRLLAVCLVVKEQAKRGDYLTVAGGPLLDWQAENADSILKVVMKYLKRLAQQENCWFVRIRPQVEVSRACLKLASQAGLVSSPMHLTADLTLELDLDQSEDELLSQMRKNTRYYIRRAQRDGVTTDTSSDPADIKQFYEHQLYLANKHNFVPFSYRFLQEQFKAFVEHDQVLLVNSYHQDQLLASAFVIFYNQEAVYHYGISTPANDDWPGSYATQWAAILEAKHRGCQTYNFWGISPEDQPQHRFAGVSLFKRGFGGREVQYLPAHDLPVHPLYWITRSFELIRKKIRGL